MDSAHSPHESLKEFYRHIFEDKTENNIEIRAEKMLTQYADELSTSDSPWSRASKKFPVNHTFERLLNGIRETHREAYKKRLHLQLGRERAASHRASGRGMPLQRVPATSAPPRSALATIGTTRVQKSRGPFAIPKKIVEFFRQNILGGSSPHSTRRSESRKALKSVGFYKSPRTGKPVDQFRRYHVNEAIGYQSPSPIRYSDGYRPFTAKSPTPAPKRAPFFARALEAPQIKSNSPAMGDVPVPPAAVSFSAQADAPKTNLVTTIVQPTATSPDVDTAIPQAAIEPIDADTSTTASNNVTSTGSSSPAMGEFSVTDSVVDGEMDIGQAPTDSGATPSGSTSPAMGEISTMEPAVVTGQAKAQDPIDSGATPNGSTSPEMGEISITEPTVVTNEANGQVAVDSLDNTDSAQTSNGTSPTESRAQSPVEDHDDTAPAETAAIVAGLEGTTLSPRRHNGRDLTKRELKKIEADRKKAEKKAKTDARKAAAKLRKEQKEAEARAKKEELERVQREKEERERLEKEEARAQAEAAEQLRVQAARAATNRRFPTQTLIQPLTKKWDDKVNAALQKSMNTQVATSVKGLEISRRDIGKLVPMPGTLDDQSGWMNDELINAYLEAVVAHYHDKVGHKRGETPRMHAFNSFLFANMKKAGGHKNVLRWAQRAKIDGPSLLNVDCVFIPANINNNHWTLVVVSPKLRTIEYFDSLHYSNTSTIATVRAWLEGELKGDYHADEWTVIEDQADAQYLGRGQGPSQTNGSDCGVFTCTTAKMVSLGVDPRSVRASDMPLQRRRIIAELMNGGFLADFAPNVAF